MFEGGEMMFAGEETDMYGHRKLGGIGDAISDKLKELSPKFNNGRRINVITQKLSYLVRSGDPDAVDSIVPMAYGNLALDLILDKKSGRMVCMHNGEFDDVPVETVTSRKKTIDVDKYYDTDRLRPQFKSFHHKPFFIATSD